jgi:hypothetical protein
MSEQVCFVVMGFGRKTDYESGRELDLDATYEAIIKPAVLAQGFRCVRADEVMHSGVIDKPMYEMLLRADLVIADISTANVNAVYELGVRHALKPYSTIIMREQAGRMYFDLNHNRMFTYEHLGKDIGAREAQRAQAELRKLIVAVTKAPCTPDSPVYTFLNFLQGPQLTDSQVDVLLDRAERKENELADWIRQGQAASKASNHKAAIEAFTRAKEIKDLARKDRAAEAIDPSEDAYILQQLALATYKADEKNEAALLSARDIVNLLQPGNSNDPETLGIAGAISKRLWLARAQRADLDAAIRFYGRGFEVRRDYYNGENLATCLDLRAAVQTDADEAKFDRMSARKTRRAVIELLEPIAADPEKLQQRSDRMWILASLANCHYAVRETPLGRQSEDRFRAEDPAAWQLATFEQGKTYALAVAALP